MKQTSLVEDALLDGDALTALDGFEGDEFSETDAFEEIDAFGDELESDLFLDEGEDSLDGFGDVFDPIPPPRARPGRGITQARRQPLRRRSRPRLPPTTAVQRMRTRPAAATLADLHNFTRTYIRDMVRRRRAIDCADLAIEVWIRFSERYGVPVSFRVWDSVGRRWLTATRAGVHAGRTRVRPFASYAAFIRWVQSNLGAQGLIGNTFVVSGGHRRAVAGDVFLWQWRNIRTRRLARTGHTQILDRVVRGRGGPNTDRITVFQGNLPPVVPERRTRPATFFYQNRTATLSAGPHTGIPVGPGPRRFNAFRSLR